ncbi:hypothetical protein [Rhodobacter ferrooxidans]|uniref:Uncharacterized protein n=1 Tax=Rhodobacter ferrooxidans TaxID=371731 RepID=C8RYT4_9RHOB|nr:hypothetical protein [Rhodobacter sp. SW2]EEW26272.1 conserved hypothetical protein [Rhodobacter sp. SW2]
MRVWVWRGVMLGLAVVAAFFAATLVLPLTTMGDPTYDTAMLRTRWWAGLGVPLLQIAVLGLLGGLAVRRPARGWGILALVCTLAGFGLMWVEQARIIQYGDLRGTAAEAALRLLVSRWATFALALAALLAGGQAWRRERLAAG